MQQTTYADQIESLAREIHARAIAGNPVTLSELLNVVIPAQPENYKIEALLASCNIARKDFESALRKKGNELEKAMKLAESNATVIDSLGAVPRHVGEF